MKSFVSNTQILKLRIGLIKDFKVDDFLEDKEYKSDKIQKFYL